MASDQSSALAWLRRPEYTGENRCIPCTVVNTILAIILGGLVWIFVGPIVAAGALFLSVVSIYFRGYLVPGTPGLTKRYLPDSILAYFDHHDGSAPQQPEVDPDVDLEGFLLSAGIVTECETQDDLCLTEEFEHEWHEEMDSVRAGDRSHRILVDLLDVDDDSEIRFESYDEAYTMYVDDQRVGTWESEAAFYADVAGAELIPRYSDAWADHSPAARSGLLASLRLFLQTCPACGGQVVLGEDTVESCCRSIDVFAVSCTECEARLFEIEQPDDQAVV